MGKQPSLEYKRHSAEHWAHLDFCWSVSVSLRAFTFPPLKQKSLLAEITKNPADLNRAEEGLDTRGVVSCFGPHWSTLHLSLVMH